MLLAPVRVCRSGILPLRKSGMDLTIGWRLVVRRWNDLAGSCSKDDSWLLEQVESNGVISKEAWTWERWTRKRCAQVHVHKNREKTRMSNVEKRESERKRKSLFRQSHRTQPSGPPIYSSNNKSKEKEIHSQSHNKKIILFHSPPNLPYCHLLASSFFLVFNRF